MSRLLSFAFLFSSIFYSVSNCFFALVLLFVTYFSGQTVTRFPFPFRSGPDRQNISSFSALNREHVKGFCNTLIRIRRKRTEGDKCSAAGRSPPRQQKGLGKSAKCVQKIRLLASRGQGNGQNQGSAKEKRRLEGEVPIERRGFLFTRKCPENIFSRLGSPAKPQSASTGPVMPPSLSVKKTRIGCPSISSLFLHDIHVSTAWTNLRSGSLLVYAFHHFFWKSFCLPGRHPAELAFFCLPLERQRPTKARPPDSPSFSIFSIEKRKGQVKKSRSPCH